MAFFDFCFSFIVFHHIPRLDIVANYIREIDRILKPGGLFMFQVNTSKWMKAFGWLPLHRGIRDILSNIGVLKWYTRVRGRNPAEAIIISKATPVYYISPRQLERVLRDTALEVVKVTGQNTRYTWYSGKKKPRFAKESAT